MTLMYKKMYMLWTSAVQKGAVLYGKCFDLFIGKIQGKKDNFLSTAEPESIEITVA